MKKISSLDRRPTWITSGYSAMHELLPFSGTERQARPFHPVNINPAITTNEEGLGTSSLPKQTIKHLELLHGGHMTLFRATVPHSVIPLSRF